MAKKFYVFMSKPAGCSNWGVSGPYSTRKKARSNWRLNAERPGHLCGPITEVVAATIGRSKHKYVQQRKKKYEARLKKLEKSTGNWSIGHDEY